MPMAELELTALWTKWLEIRLHLLLQPPGPVRKCYLYMFLSEILHIDSVRYCSEKRRKRERLLRLRIKKWRGNCTKSSIVRVKFYMQLIKIMEMWKFFFPWRYSSEEPRPTEVVAATWQIGNLLVSKALSLNLNFNFLSRISLPYFSYQVATQLSSRGWVDPFLDPIFQKIF